MLGVAVLIAGCSSEAPKPTPGSRKGPADEPAFPPSRTKFDVGAVPTAIPQADPTVPEHLRERLSDAKSVGMPLRSYETVRRFYEQREYRPAWTVSRRISAVGVDALRALGQLPAHGLDPADYGTEALAPRGPEPDDAVAFDMLLTDAWLTAAVHLRHGRLRPDDLRAQWSADGRADDLIPILETALLEGNPQQTLLAQAHSHREYTARVEALAALQERAKKDPTSPNVMLEPLTADLERLRWLPRELGPRHVRIDLGAGQLTMRDGAKTTLTMPVAQSRRCAAADTKVDAIASVELHPSSNALGSIVVHASDGLDLHGAPADAPFSASDTLRAGCLRPEQPEALAKALLPTPEALTAALAKGEPQTIALTPPIPLYVTRTTVALEGSTPVLRDGAQARNAALLKALRSGRPTPIRQLPETETKAKAKGPTPKEAKAPKPGTSP